MLVQIMCLGNELAADDGIGIRVGRVLNELELPSNVQVDLRRMVGFELLDSLQPDAELLIVDATSTGEPAGQCTVRELAQVAALATTPYCCHGVGLAELLEAMRRVRPEALPARVRLVGVEAQVIDQCTTELSAPVRDALPEAVAQVLTLIEAPAALVAQGRSKAEELKSWAPGPLEIIG